MTHHFTYFSYYQIFKITKQEIKIGKKLTEKSENTKKDLKTLRSVGLRPPSLRFRKINKIGKKYQRKNGNQ